MTTHDYPIDRDQVYKEIAFRQACRESNNHAIARSQRDTLTALVLGLIGLASTVAAIVALVSQ